ncbi:acetyltransferase [Aquabacterium sp.]|uniref:acetyltransferase n=1 Tax=Aquabacterium sp. TaxID=1872578 RepID=UPI002E2F8F60|nr:acetyltransferase [Aquabacterium sp.]HEX5310954.1 acetyltransferase [Aquabacterium sp.]
MDNIVIVGSSGHAKVIIDIVEKAGQYRLIGLLDRFRQIGELTSGHAVLGGEEHLPDLIQTHQIAGVIVGIGDNFVRAQVAARIRALCPDLPFVSAIHPSAQIGKGVSIGAGTVVMAGACINPDTRVGEHCIVNTRASLDHDSVLGDYASLAPGVTTGGGCNIGPYAAISIGATLIHRVEIGEHAVIGAGAVVTRSVAPHVVAFGVPANTVRRREAGDKYL